MTKSVMPKHTSEQRNMKRDITFLQQSSFEAIVIGGGIHGATILHQLAVSGVRAVLLEQNDFATGASNNSLKILHSGLRYLQHLNIKRIRESVRSRKYFMAMAPHLIKPMPCIMPTYGLGIEGKPVMGTALFLFDLISCDRNTGAPPANRVGRGRLLSQKECLQIAPAVRKAGLTGASLWYDDIIVNTERMVLSYLKEAVRHQAVCANYIHAEKICREQNETTGVQVTDRLSGQSFMIQAPLVINAAGPWLTEIQQRSQQQPTTEDFAKAVNIVVDKALFPGYGVGLSGTKEYTDQDAALKRSKRLFFFAPWRNKTLIGTTYTYVRGLAEDSQVTENDINELLGEINAIYPAAGLTVKDVIYTHAGKVAAYHPLHNNRQLAPQIVKHSEIIDHEQREGIRGLYTIESVKYTTAPAIAAQLGKLLAKKGCIPLHKLKKLSEKPDQTLSPAAEAALARYSATYPHILENYGRIDAAEIFLLLTSAEDAERMILDQPPLLAAEILHAVQQEMAISLADVVLRRTACGTLGCPPREKLLEIAAVMAPLRGWNDTQAGFEVDNLRKFYQFDLGITVSSR